MDEMSFTLPILQMIVTHFQSLNQGSVQQQWEHVQWRSDLGVADSG
jgi:hypothetical protein